MRIKSMFHTRKPKAYNYKPIYYDEVEERHKRLKEKYEQGADNPIELSGIRSSWYNREQEQRKTRKASNTRLGVILILLIFVAYYVFYS